MDSPGRTSNRRAFLGSAGLMALAGLGLIPNTSAAKSAVKKGDDRRSHKRTAEVSPAAIQRLRLPKSGELVPVIGLGTSRTFDVDPGAENTALVEVMQRFFAWGGSLIDSSPMYKRSEEVVGTLCKKVGRDDLFFATKVWTPEGKQAGIKQMERSQELMGTARFDLLQVHNLVDLEVQLQTLKEWKQQRRVRYVGVTEMKDFAKVEELVSSEQLDFIQIPYSVTDRRVEERLLPACMDHGVAVLVMRPYERGRLFGAVKGKDLPTWAADFGATSWGQLFLKFILGHPATMLPIPATSKAHHLDDNMAAGLGAPLDESSRLKLIKILQD
ncbi:MAG: aldo/keto reductase [Planctomycetes bacterium]|nr:aldo/keto reductase [Planctomycetota bacterium]